MGIYEENARELAAMRQVAVESDNHGVAQTTYVEETPRQKAMFYLEVAALLGNESAAQHLRDLQKADKG